MKKGFFSFAFLRPKWGADLYQVIFPQGSISPADLRMGKRSYPDSFTFFGVQLPP